LGLAISGEITQFLTEGNKANEGKPSFCFLFDVNFQKFQRISPNSADAPVNLRRAIQKNIPFVSFVSFCSNFTTGVRRKTRHHQLVPIF
jgi:hypothetical protein